MRMIPSFAFVSRIQAGRPRATTKLETLLAHVGSGGTAVYLNVIPPGYNPWKGGRMVSRELLPVKASGIKAGKGLWVGVSHIVKDHPIFSGLPTNCMMGQVYENIWAQMHLKDMEGELIAGAVTHDWFQGQKDKQHYLGPDKASWGAEMAIVHHGEGRLIVSTLRILENLGKDPAAEKILFNLITWAAEGE